MALAFDQQAAYILHRRPYRETSFILDAYTLYHGRVSILAKGATRGKYNFSALLQMFQPLLLSWSGRSNLKTLTDVEAPSAAFTFISEQLYCAFYLNELVLKLTPEAEADPVLFSAYADALQGLKDKQGVEIVLRTFELALLKSIGLAPEFLYDTASREIQANLLYMLNPEQGFSLIKNGNIQRERWDSLKGLKPVFDGASLLSIGNKNLIELTEKSGSANEQKMVLREAKQIMRILITYALQGQELKSRALFCQFKQLKQPKKGPESD